MEAVKRRTMKGEATLYADIIKEGAGNPKSKI
jgi:hypothetical protein